MRLLLLFLITFQLGSFISSSVEAEESVELSSRLNIVVGKSLTLTIEEQSTDIIVGDPDVADVVIVGPNRLYVLGKSLGTTNVRVLGTDGVVLGIYDLVVGADLVEAERALQSAFPNHPIRVHSVNGGLRLSGSLPDQESIDRAMQIARSFLRNQLLQSGGGQSGSDGDAGGDLVINTLTISDPPQVYLSVQIIEVSRSVSQRLNSSLSQFEATVNSSGVQIAGGPLSTLNIAIDALSANGLARLLATPTLTAQSGETASFLAGGEVLIPSETADGGATTTEKEFGVRLTFTPQVLMGGSIRLQLEPEVSQIDELATATGSLPAFTTRRASTTVTLRDGESFVIAGLLQSNQTRGIDRLPGLGDIPVVGALFRDSALTDTATDLMIVVTPSLTRPISQISTLDLPTDDRRAASGWDFFAEGMQEVSTYTLEDALRGREITGSFGPMLQIGGNGAFTGVGE